MRKEIVGAFFTFVILVGPSEPSTAQVSSCDKTCLVNAMDEFLDEKTGKAVPALSDGRAGYISTRIRALGGEILDVELSSDTSDRAVEPYVYNVEQRFPVIDPESGIVFGVTLLLTH